MELRERYTQELQNIQNEVISLTRFCIQQVQSALCALETDNAELSCEVLANDAEIDRREVEISNACIKFIALEGPVAGDLRQLVSIIKFVSNIARIGDHARHLIEGRSWFSEHSKKDFLPFIREMADFGVEILEIGMSALNEDVAHLPKKIPALESKIGQLKKRLTSRIESYMTASPDNIEEGAGILFLNRFMERFGDHAANFCEWVYFAKTGAHIELN